jgi:hypothetical protein
VRQLRGLVERKRTQQSNNQTIRKQRKGTNKMIYKIETPQGFLEYEFDSKQAAEDYALGILSWTGTRYRIIGPIITAKEN